MVDCQWSDGNSLLLSASLDGTVRAWAADRGVCVRTLSVPGAPLTAAFHPTNNNLVVVCTYTTHQPRTPRGSVMHTIAWVGLYWCTRTPCMCVPASALSLSLRVCVCLCAYGGRADGWAFPGVARVQP
jgi:WD40 repeat protein